MLELAQQYPWILGVVGWLDLSAPDAAASLDKLAANRHFKGVRPHLDEKTNFSALTAGLQALIRHRLTCVIMLSSSVFRQTLWLASACPDVCFIFDHLGDPFNTPGGLRAWKEILQPIAALPWVIAMKVSGYLTATPIRNPSQREGWRPTW